MSYLGDKSFIEHPKSHIRNSQVLAGYQKLTKEGAFDLSPSERWWSEHYDCLLSHGYQLRRRFKPGWKPSWLDTDLMPYACEDAYRHNPIYVIDALRLSDGSDVAIKHVDYDCDETRIAQMLSAPDKLQESANHCVPILDHFRDDNEDYVEYLVMPLLQAFDRPPFLYVEEAIDFVRQTLIGLAYIHNLGVAHRDLSDKNIMMNGKPIFPQGFHPSWTERSAKDVTENAPFLNRSDSVGVKYYFIDFELSSYFEDSNVPRLVRGAKAADGDVPELDAFELYDPFAVDVFTLGNVFKRNLLKKYSNLGFLEPLVHAMMQQEPKRRPSAPEALNRFERIIKRLSAVSMRWRLHDYNERISRKIILDLHTAFREVRRIYKYFS